MDCSLADTLPVRRERSDHMALAQLTERAENNRHRSFKRGIKMPSPMKLYNHALAPNPRRVRIFAAEKGIELRLADVDILAGQSRTTEFLAKNSSGGVPVLELDDGSHLSESVAICRYLEGLHPGTKPVRTRPSRAGGDRAVESPDGVRTVRRNWTHGSKH